MVDIIITIGVVLIFVFIGYKYIKYMKNRKVKKPHCGACK